MDVKLSAEKSFLLQILSDHLNGRQTALPEYEFDWTELSRLARIHQVDGIVYYQCKKNIPAEFADSFKKGYSAATFYYTNRVKAVEEITAAFKENDIKYFAIKGLDVASLYPVPALRTMGDCDFVVDTDDMEKAKSVLSKIGYTGEDVQNLQEWAFDGKGLHFELHDSLVKYDEKTEKYQSDFFADYMDHATDGKLDWNYHYIYLIMHLRRHIINGGAGIRQFMDLAVFRNNAPSPDWNWIEEKLQALSIADFAHVCNSVTEECFGAGEVTNISVIDRILDNGVFGFENSDNDSNITKSDMAMGKGPMWFRRFTGLMKSTFPGYDVMVSYPGCGFVKNRKYLLPAAWIRRFFYLLRRKDFDKAKSTINQSFIPEDEIKKQQDFLSKMGL